MTIQPENLTKEYFYKQIVDDIPKQVELGNLFKAIKRVYSASRIVDDVKNVKLIEPLLISNVAKLATIAGDLKTIILLLKTKAKINLDYTKSMLQMVKDKISTILDIDFKEKYLDESIDKLTVKLSVKTLNKMVEYISSITNRETREYLRHKNISFPKTL